MNRREFFATVAGGITTSAYPLQQSPPDAGSVLGLAYHDGEHLFYEIPSEEWIKYSCAIGGGFWKAASQ